MVRYTGGVKNEKKSIRKLDLSTEMSRRTKDKEVASINVRVLIRSSDPIGWHAIAGIKFLFPIDLMR